MKATAGFLAIAAVLSLALAVTGGAAEIEVSGETGDLIGNVADVVGAFKLSRLPAQLHVTADRMEFNFKEGRLAYDGNVDVRHGEIQLKSDSLIMTFEPEDPQSLRTIAATGNVEVVRGEEIARGQSCVYDPNKATLKLTGGATLGTGPNVVSGESVMVYIDEGRAIVEGGKGPVRATIEPSSLEDEELLN